MANLSASRWPQLYDSAFTARKAVLDQAYNILITEQVIDDGGASNPAVTSSGTGQLTLDYDLPASDPKIPLIQNEMCILINYPAVVGGQTQDVFVIRSVETGTQSGSLIYRAHAEARWYELGTDEPVAVTPAVTTPTAALTAILAGTGWTIGTISPSLSGGAANQFQILTKATPLAAVRSLPAVFGGEVVFDTVLRKVSLLTVRGSTVPTALYARKNNVADDNRVVDTSQMVTRLYPLGASGLDITTVNAGIGYVENYSWFDSQSPPWPHVIKSATSTNASLSDPALLKAWGQQQVAMLGLPRATYTVNPVLLQTDTVPGLGDTVRVWDNTIALNNNARVVNRILDLLQPWNTKLQINTSAFTLANALPAGTPTGAAMPVAALDTLAPAAPTGIVVTGLDVIDGNGNHVEYLNFSWNAVTTNSDASPITDLDHYEIQYRIGSNNWISAGESATASIQSGPMPPSAVFSVRVRAADKSFNSSAWTIFTGITPGIPVSALTTPSVPTLDGTTFPLTVRATWGGKDNVAAPYPSNFDHMEVHISTVSGFTPSVSGTLVDTLRDAGTSPITGRVAGTTYYVRFVAVDTAGLKSAASAQASVVATAVQDGQITSLSISKLLVGSLIVDLTVAARIKTANTGARVELSSGGLYAFDSGGVQTLSINAADGSVTALGGTFTGSALIGATITGTMITGSTIRTATSGARFEVDTAGARLFDGNGNLNVNLPTDPSQTASFTGNISAIGITVQDHLSLQGINNEFAAQSITTLQAGIMPPATSPSVNVGYLLQDVSVSNYDNYSNEYFGLWALTGGGFGRGWFHYNYTDYITKLQVEEFDVNGNLTYTSPILTSLRPIGVAAFGTNIISLVHNGNNDYTLYTFDRTSGAMQSASGFTYPSGSHLPTIFTDASWLYIAYTTATQVIIERRDPGQLNVLGTYAGANAGIARDLTSGIGLANFDYGAPRFLLTDDVSGAFAYAWTASGSVITPAPNDNWPLPYGDVPYGMAWDNTRFFVGTQYDHSKLTKMSLFNWTTESNVWWAKYSWDQMSTGYMTKSSPSTKFTMAKRGWITMSVPQLGIAAQQPDAIMPYLGRGAADPGDAGMWHDNSNALVQGARTVILGGILFAFSGTQPLAVGTFPTGVAGKMVSSALRADQTPKWTISGDGTVLIQDVTVAGNLSSNTPIFVAGDQQPRFRRQNSNGVVTNAGGQWTGAHGCPFTPTAVFITNNLSNSYSALFWGSSAITATSVTLRWMNASGTGPLVSANTGAWTALYIA